MNIDKSLYGEDEELCTTNCNDEFKYELEVPFDDIEDCSSNCDVVDRYKNSLDELIKELIEKQDITNELLSRKREV